MIKIKRIEVTDNCYTNNTITIDYEGIINFNKIIPQLIKALEDNQIQQECTKE